MGMQNIRMQDWHVHFTGFSESRAIVKYGAAGALRCLPPNLGDWDADECCADKRWTQERDASFLATCREQNSSILEATCENSAGLSFRWKSSAIHPPTDDAIESYLRAKAATSRVVAIYSVGVHHFATEPGHSHIQEFVLPDSWAPPHGWMDRWFAGMQSLLKRLEALREAGVCVLWKLNNIGMRLPGNTHHPSARGAWHDHLNQCAASLAASHHLPVIDVVPITARHNFSQNPDKPEGIASGDMYHAYDAAHIWRLVDARIAAECGSVARSGVHVASGQAGEV